MATRLGRPAGGTRSIAPDWIERALALLAAALFAAAVIAVIRGQSEWARIPLMIWAHLLTVLIAVGLTPVMLLRRRGDAAHRLMGTIWVVAMIATALSSFALRGINSGGFSWIHLLSIWTLIQVPLIWWAARTHRVARHRGAVRGMVIGGLLIAGFFTFPFDRLLGRWLIG